MSEAWSSSERRWRGKQARAPTSTGSSTCCAPSVSAARAGGFTAPDTAPYYRFEGSDRRRRAVHGLAERTSGEGTMRSSVIAAGLLVLVGTAAQAEIICTQHRGCRETGGKDLSYRRISGSRLDLHDLPGWRAQGRQSKKNSTTVTSSITVVTGHRGVDARTRSMPSARWTAASI